MVLRIARYGSDSGQVSGEASPRHIHLERLHHGYQARNEEFIDKRSQELGLRRADVIRRTTYKNETKGLRRLSAPVQAIYLAAK